mmetsp:Transcript_8394/g.23906  ORF Transcript_8394/g.23906 Transcript_8394/m.23906 type:complete len:147 (+) Transcript_8394:455-895(+)
MLSPIDSAAAGTTGAITNPRVSATGTPNELNDFVKAFAAEKARLEGEWDTAKRRYENLGNEIKVTDDQKAAARGQATYASPMKRIKMHPWKRYSRPAKTRQGPGRMFGAPRFPGLDMEGGGGEGWMEERERSARRSGAQRGAWVSE